MKQETKIKTFGMTMIIASGIYFAAYAKWDYQDCHKHTDLFVNGQILLPDYSIQDTMVVINSAYLNECMNDGKMKSDDDIYEIVQECSVTIQDYQDYINVVKK